MILEYFEEVIDELAFNYGMRKKHVASFLTTFLTNFPVGAEDYDLVSECLERVVSERSSIYKYYSRHKSYSLLTSMKRAYEDVFGNRINNDSNSLEATIREDEALRTIKLVNAQF